MQSAVEGNRQKEEKRKGADLYPHSITEILSERTVESYFVASPMKKHLASLTEREWGNQVDQYRKGRQGEKKKNGWTQVVANEGETSHSDPSRRTCGIKGKEEGEQNLGKSCRQFKKGEREDFH